MGYDAGMARIARVVAPRVPQHITQRGNRCQQTFFCDEDYQAYLQLMAQRCGRWGMRVSTRAKSSIVSPELV